MLQYDYNNNSQKVFLKLLKLELIIYLKRF